MTETRLTAETIGGHTFDGRMGVYTNFISKFHRIFHEFMIYRLHPVRPPIHLNPISLMIGGLISAGRVPLIGSLDLGPHKYLLHQLKCRWPLAHGIIMSGLESLTFTSHLVHLASNDDDDDDDDEEDDDDDDGDDGEEVDDGDDGDDTDAHDANDAASNNDDDNDDEDTAMPPKRRLRPCPQQLPGR